METENQDNDNITVQSLLHALEQARRIAKSKGDASAMVAATMGMAKLVGLDRDESPEVVARKIRALVGEMDSVNGSRA